MKQCLAASAVRNYDVLLKSCSISTMLYRVAVAAVRRDFGRCGRCWLRRRWENQDNAGARATLELPPPPVDVPPPMDVPPPLNAPLLAAAPMSTCRGLSFAPPPETPPKPLLGLHLLEQRMHARAPSAREW